MDELVKKWKPTKLLQLCNNDEEKENLAHHLEYASKQLIKDYTKYSEFQLHIILPLIVRIFNKNPNSFPKKIDKELYQKVSETLLKYNIIGDEKMYVDQKANDIYDMFTSKMTEDIFIEIFEKTESDITMWGDDNCYAGLQIIAKYSKNIVTGAEHDIIYSDAISNLIEAGITEEDVKQLALLNWMIEDECYLACFV